MLVTLRKIPRKDVSTKILTVVGSVVGNMP
jgi:hypothetical protein